MSSKIQATKNYALFKSHTSDNRPLVVKKHKKLLESMKRYGFLGCFPIVVARNAKGELEVKDGQHRLAIAQMLELAVFYVEEATPFDVAIVNSAAKVWVLRDYAQKYAANGKPAYQEGMDFADQHKLAIGTAFALLAGTTTFTNCQDAFLDGSFRVKDRGWADAVAGIYVPTVLMAPVTKRSAFVEACMAVCRVEEFKAERYLGGLKGCQLKLLAYATRDAYLTMIEAVYNYRRTQGFGLRIAAINAMRKRNVAAHPNGKKKPQAKKEPVPV